jgi:sensor histidine kinase YesM
MIDRIKSWSEIKENTENYIFTIEDNGSGIEELITQNFRKLWNTNNWR